MMTFIQQPDSSPSKMTACRRNQDCTSGKVTDKEGLKQKTLLVTEGTRYEWPKLLVGIVVHFWSGHGMQEGKSTKH